MPEGQHCIRSPYDLLIVRGFLHFVILGISQSTLSRWLKEARESDDGKINAPGSGNYQSDVAKENARLKRELRDTKDALEILKKAISILGE